MHLRLIVSLLTFVLIGSQFAHANPSGAPQKARTIREWANSVFSGKTPRTIAASWARLPTIRPFSFTYGGASSSDLLPKWKRNFSTRKLDKNRLQHTLSYEDPQTGLVTECIAVVYADFSAVDYVLKFTNKGAKDTPILEHILPLDFPVGARKGETIRLHYANGSVNSAEDFMPNSKMVVDGETVQLNPVGGRSSNGRMPWYNLQWEDGGLVVMVGWSGQWEAKISRGEAVKLQAGTEDDHLSLRPGETFRTPRIALVQWNGTDHLKGYNLNRQLLLSHYMPRKNGQVVFPPVAKNIAYDELDLNPWRSHHGEANQLEIIKEANGLGIEFYWMDAYWFNDYYPAGVGNWQFPVRDSVRDSFPNGLKPLADEAHKRGMQFILWFEPERVAPHTYIARTKPEWLIHLPKAKENLKVTNFPDTGLYDLGIPVAREWMTRYITECLKEFDVDVFRIDFNTNPLPFWQHKDATKRRGATENQYIQGLYRMWDEIIASKNGMWIDNCASGGRRIDLETCSRSLPLWRSDFNDTPNREDEIRAISDQVMTMGLSLHMPLHAGPVWKADPYFWRSASSAGNIIYWDVRPNRDGSYGYDRELTKKAIHETQSLRPYYLGDYFPLTAINTDPRTWAAYQYIRPEFGDGFAVFFRRPQSPSSTFKARLRNVDPKAQYQVTWYWTFDKAQTRILKGTQLASFDAEIKDRPGSLLIKFERIRHP